MFSWIKKGSIEDLKVQTILAEAQWIFRTSIVNEREFRLVKHIGLIVLCS